MRYPRLSLCVLSLCSIVPAQLQIREYKGGAVGGQAGSALAILGDLDGDGKAEVLVGIPEDDSGEQVDGSFLVPAPRVGDELRRQQRGRVMILSRNVVLASVIGAANGDRFGHAVAAVGDVNGDGKPDFVVGAPYSKVNGTMAGQVQLISGRTLTPLATIEGAPGERLGWSVCHAGGGRFAVGAPYANAGAGRVVVYNQLGGQERVETSAPQAAQSSEHFGWSVSGPALGTTKYKIAIGAPDFDGSLGLDQGRIFVRSGSASDWRVEGQTAKARFGYAVALMGDANGDGSDDVAVGAPYAYADQSGAVFMVSGAGTHANLWDKTGSAGSRFGAALARMGDVNGLQDLILGAPGMGGGAGRASVRDGATGTALVEFLPRSAYGSGNFGAAVAGGGDIAGDGTKNDCVIGMPLANVSGFTKTGYVEAFQVTRWFPPVPWLAVSLLSKTGTADGDRTGTQVARLGDLDGDGIAELAVGSPHEEVANLTTAVAGQAGRVRIYSGATEVLLRLHESAIAGDNFGWAIARCGDLDQDGFEDYAIGAPQMGRNGTGYVRIFSGRTAGVLRELVGATKGDEFGFALAGNADATGDGRVDLLVGAPSANATRGGYASLVDGVTWQTAKTLSGAYGGLLGHAVAMLGDVTGDGTSEFLVGEPFLGTVSPRAGRAVVIRGGGSFDVLRTHDATGPGQTMGFSCSALGDVNGDGVGDYAVGSPAAADPSAVGTAHVRSGANGDILQTRLGVFPELHVGTSVGAAADVDGDGRADLLVSGEGFVDVVLATGMRHVRIESSANSLTQLGDIDGDGKIDVAIGAAGWSPATESTRYRGRALVYSLTASTLASNAGGGLALFAGSRTAVTQVLTVQGNGGTCVALALATRTTTPLDVPCALGLDLGDALVVPVPLGANGRAELWLPTRSAAGVTPSVFAQALDAGSWEPSGRRFSNVVSLR